MSIRRRVSLVIGLVVALVAVGLSFYLDQSSRQQIDDLTERGIESAKASFDALEAADIAKLNAALDVMLTRADIRDLYLAGDRDALYEYVAPLFKELEESHSITHWYFETTEDEPQVFLRVHRPDESGDALSRQTYLEAVQTGAIGAGKELGKTAFALRVVRPYHDADGELIGYMEFGEEIDHFLDNMKEQLGNEFGFLIDKEHLDREAYAEFHATRETRDDWDDHERYVVMDATSEQPELVEFDGVFADVDPDGEVLDRVDVEGTTFARGAFPVMDNDRNKVGAVIVLQDITDTAASVEGARNGVIVALAVAGLALVSIIVLVLNGLVFRRLNNMTSVLEDVSTRTVGGDYEMGGTIVSSGHDEIGDFEEFFGRLLELVADILKQLTSEATPKA